jgi:large-conductance mechanosensitive channel
MDINKIIKNLKYNVLDFVLIILNFLRLNLVGFLNFLFNKNIIQTSIGIIVASQIGRLTNLFVDTILNPVVDRITGGSIKKHEDLTITLLDVKIKIGLIISTLINFLLIIFIVYNIWKISQYSNFDFINNLITDTKETVKSAKTNVVINIPSQVAED